MAEAPALKVTPTALPEVLMLEPRVFGDDRGFFLESWNERVFREATRVEARFVQDNHSRSARHVLRGIHYQVVRPQGKLVRVTRGAVLDVAVDLRRSSPRFGQWVALELTGDVHRQLWIPPGFGHGFLVLSETADFLYKTTDFRCVEHERSIAWNDPTLQVDWQLGGHLPQLAPKDRAAPRLETAELYD